MPTPPTHLVALHGFGGSGADFDLLRDRLDARADCAGAQRGRLDLRWCCPDLPGHGPPPHPTDNRLYTVPAAAAGVAAVLRGLPTGRRCLLGYSMGGRIALRVALDHPTTIDLLVLVGAHPGLTTEAERATRRTRDADLAAEAERIGAAAFADRWAAQPLIATQARIPAPYGDALRARRRAADPFALARSLRLGGTGSMEPMSTRLADLDVPCLLVAGAEDGAYAAHVATMAGLLPRARPTLIPGAGHAAHLEAPDAFLDRLLSFLAAPR